MPTSGYACACSEEAAGPCRTQGMLDLMTNDFSPVPLHSATACGVSRNGARLHDRVRG